jgi:heme A synthase
MTTPPPRWLHALAVLTVVATLPLVFLGAEVTTKDAGMSDPIGFRTPWDLIQRLADAVGFGGLQIEYSHRLAGFTVGLCAIALAVSMAVFDRRRGWRWMGAVALALVCIQGMLGKYRVDLNALFGRDLALVHGAFAQLVIAVLVCVALVTSRGWVRSDFTTEPRALASGPDPHANAHGSAGLRRGSILTMLLIYGQLILGGVIRHRDFLLGSRLHLTGAFIVAMSVVWLYRRVRQSERRPGMAFAANMLLGLVGLQILLGIEAWLSRAQAFFLPGAPLPHHADWIRSAHYVLGTLIFATSVVIALKANRRPVPLEDPAPARSLEGAL